MDRYNLQGLKNIYSKRISEKPDWGIEIANLLIEEEDWKNELWESIFLGLLDSINERNDWERFFDLILRLENLQLLQNEISNFLKKSINNEENPIPNACLNKADKLAERLIDELIDENESFNNNLDWLMLAINRPAGKLCEFYLAKIDREIEKREDRYLSNHYKKIFNKIVSKDSDFANLFIVVLISQVHFISSLDYEWTKEKLLPRLHSKNKQELIQAWSGFLVWGKWNSRLINDLIPAYKKFHGYINTLERKLQESFCNHIASICVQSPLNPFEDDFLLKFIQETGTDTHNSFSQKLKDYLKRTNEELHEEIWDEWLKNYLEKRSEGIPSGLTDQEVENFLYLIIYLKGITQQLFEYLINLDFPDLDHYFFFNELNESSIPQEYPVITAKIVNKLLNNIHQPFWDFEEIKKLTEKLLKGHPSAVQDELHGICNSLSRLGYSKASKLHNKVKSIS